MRPKLTKINPYVGLLLILRSKSLWAVPIKTVKLDGGGNCCEREALGAVVGVFSGVSARRALVGTVVRKGVGIVPYHIW